MYLAPRFAILAKLEFNIAKKMTDDTKHMSEKESEEGGIGEIIRVVVHALILALLVRTLLYQPFNIPSGSMKSTLLVGDYLFVSKFSYGYSKYSFPLGMDLFSGRVWASEPKRGDVVVFKFPKDNSTDYIKRLVGMPGDKIQVTNGILHINGTAVKRKRIKNFRETDHISRHVRDIERFQETLPNGVTYTTLDLTKNGLLDNTQVYKVPAGHYFMMGDNRDNSTDSRVLSEVGYVPFENLVGRAEILFFSVDNSARLWEIWRWPTAIRWNRLFNLVK